VRPERFDETLRSALEGGITTFDCAPVWGDSEERVGRALAEAKADAIVITRAGTRLVDGKLEQSFTEDALVADCEASLKRLGRDTIDLWLLHNPGDVSIQTGDWRGAVDRLEAEGKIRAWGMSIGDAEEAHLAIDAGAQAICITHNLLASGDLDSLTDAIEEHGCKVLARSPLMFGLLAGIWSDGRRFSEHDHRERRWNRHSFEERVRQVDELRFLVGPDHPDLATAAIRFVLSHTAVSSVVLGARSPYQISAGVEAAKGPPYLSDVDVVRIGKVRDALGI